LFEEFSNKKIAEYLNQVEFSSGKISFRQIQTSSLPDYIIHFCKCSLGQDDFVTKDELEDLFRRAVAFYINYVLKPKQTILKFVFGEFESRPAEYVTERLKYFQFYEYYPNHLLDFISTNSPLTVSKEQVNFILEQIDKKIYEEITDEANKDSVRLNLLKLIFYFFADLIENKPVNKKLPKKLLSIFLSDKGFKDLKEKADKFFSDEIFIQEAVELLKTKPIVVDLSKNKPQDEDVSEYIKDAKKNVDSGEKIEDTETMIKTIAEEKPVVKTEKIISNKELYSEDLLVKSSDEALVNDNDEQQITTKLIEEIFCEETYRKKIIKRLFAKDENKFIEKVKSILESKTWTEASYEIENYFDENKIDFYSPEAIKFVDLLQNHYFTTEEYSSAKLRTS